MDQPPSHEAIPQRAAPTCPRHPDRESHIRCQRCDRPACAECQRPAAVGVHCVDCVAEYARNAPRTRTAFGTVARPGKPVVTYSLMAVCIVIWVLQQVPGLPVTGWGAFMPALGFAEPWRFLTAAFLHAPGQIMHILFNMLALWTVGQALEPVMGRARFLVGYLLCALGGSVGFMWLSPPVTDPSSTWFVSTVGASGAVFGLFGMLLVVLRHLGRQAGGILGILLINAALPLFVPGIAWQAHLGGFLTGLAVAGILILGRKLSSPAAQWGAYASLAVVLFALIGVKYWVVAAGIGV